MMHTKCSIRLLSKFSRFFFFSPLSWGEMYEAMFLDCVAIRVWCWCMLPITMKWWWLMGWEWIFCDGNIFRVLGFFAISGVLRILATTNVFFQIPREHNGKYQSVFMYVWVCMCDFVMVEWLCWRRTKSASVRIFYLVSSITNIFVLFFGFDAL